MSRPRDLVLWLLEQGYETKYFKLSHADQTDWHEAAILEAERLKTIVDNNLYQEYLSRLDGLGIKPKFDSLDSKSLHDENVDLKSAEDKKVHQMPINSLQNNLTSELKRAIDFRNEGKNKESLKILKSMVESGFRSDLIDDNYARALVKLRRIPEALSLWEKLVDSDIQSVKKRSRQFVKKYLGEFQDKLSKICDQNAWNIVYMKNSCSKFKELESLIRKEVIEINSACRPELSMLLIQCARQIGFQSSALNDKQTSDSLLKRAINFRDEGEYDQSLDLLNIATKADFKSDLIDDNRARALIKLRRIPEALSIWENLADSDVQSVKESSRKLVKKYLQEFQEKLIKICDLNSWEVVSIKNNCNSFRQLESLVHEELVEINSACRPEIAMLLIQCARQIGFKSSAFNDKQVSELLLKRAIDLRNKGEHEQSLELLNIAIKAEFKSDLIDDNRARALVKLHRISEALSIWEKLFDSNIQSIKDNSRQFVEKYLQEFKDKLTEICDQDCRDIIYLNKQCESFKELEMYVLKEVIELRNAGYPETSLRLIKRAYELGFTSSTLTDNEARALVSLKRLRDAITVWSELVNSSSDNVSTNAKKMVGKFDAIAANSIKNRVSNVASSLDVDLINVNKLEFVSLSALEDCLLRDVIAVRDGGNDEAALRIIDSALSAGARRDEHLLDNRARALNNLNRLPEAISVWKELQRCANKDLREKSKKFADNASEKYLMNVKKALDPICSKNGLNISHLLSSCENFQDLEKLVLQEAISARRSGRAEFSYNLILKSCELGITSLRLKDNQARALINLKRIPEAVAIWRELLNSTDKSEFKQQIQKMLDEYGLISDRDCIIEKCSEYAADGDMDAAKSIAINAIIDDPDWDESMDLLLNILKIESGKVDGQSSMNSDLQDHQLDLKSYQLIINHIERRVENLSLSDCSASK